MTGAIGELTQGSRDVDAIERRGFLKLAAAGSAAAATALAGAGRGHTIGDGPFSFRAIAPLPQPPHNAWAAHVVDGTVDLEKGLGLVTSCVMAAGIALPGLTQVMRVTSASRQGQRVRLNTVVEDRSQLRQGESLQSLIVVDRSRSMVQAPFLGRPIEHRLS